MIETFNGRLRDEGLNANVVLSLPDTRQKIEAWRIDYKERRPHGALGYLMPREFAKRTRRNSTSSRTKFLTTSGLVFGERSFALILLSFAVLALGVTFEKEK